MKKLMVQPTIVAQNDFLSLTEIEKHEFPLTTKKIAYVYRCQWPQNCFRLAKLVCARLLAPEFEIISANSVAPELVAQEDDVEGRAGCAVAGAFMAFGGNKNANFETALCRLRVEERETRETEFRQREEIIAASTQREIVFTCSEEQKERKSLPILTDVAGSDVDTGY
jgi:DNA primase large subunit